LKVEYKAGQKVEVRGGGQIRWGEELKKACQTQRKDTGEEK